MAIYHCVVMVCAQLIGIFEQIDNYEIFLHKIAEGTDYEEQLAAVKRRLTLVDDALPSGVDDEQFENEGKPILGIIKKNINYPNAML